jgi:hypothetical protein
MQNNIIIELNEKEAIHKIQNGEWISNLSKSIVIEEGDTLQLKSSMLDAIAQTAEQINIDRDLKLVLKFGMYYNDWLPLWTETDTPPEYLFYERINNNGSGNTQSLGDGRYVIPYKKISGFDTGFSSTTGWNFANLDNTAPSAPFVIQYSYIDINNQLTYLNHNIPSIPKNSEYTDYFSLIFKDGTLKIVSPDISKNGLVSYGPANVTPIVTDNGYAPYNFEAVVLLPKGNYTAPELSLFISKELSKNATSPFNQGTDTNYIDNPFLKNTNMFIAGQVQPDGHGGTIPEPVYYVRYDIDNQSLDSSFDGAMIINDTPAGAPAGFNNSIFLGASQIALDYDQDSSSFQWSYLHTPLLDSATGKNLSIKYLNNTNNISAIGAHSGIYFTNLHAEDMEGNLFDFWRGVIGLDVDNICVDYQDVLINQFGVSNSSWVILEPLQLSKNITSAYIGIDTAVIKTTNTWMKQQKIPSASSANWIDSTADPNTTTQIRASIKLPELQNTFSHYLIDLGMKFQNELIGADEVYRSYNGIINKFYNFGSYIYSDDGAGGIAYQHKGAPIVLKSVKCAIRRSSDRQVDDNLGNNSCIYMQLIKAPPKV